MLRPLHLPNPLAMTLADRAELELRDGQRRAAERYAAEVGALFDETGATSKSALGRRLAALRGLF